VAWLAVTAGLAACDSGASPLEPLALAAPSVAAALVAHAAPAAASVAVAAAGLPHGTPDEVGMSAERLAVLDRLVARGIAEGGYPGAALVVGRRGHTVWQRGYGTLAWVPAPRPVSATRRSTTWPRSRRWSVRRAR
jgi:hypothetical protein